MNAERQFPYHYKVYESSIFVELYLPKKAHYQGALYKALTKGFKIEAVKRHFRKYREEIIELMKGYYIAGGMEERLEKIDDLPEFYKGYSMYEVDGVFYDEGVTFEEKTQVIRIFFRPNLKEVRRITKSMDKRKSAWLVKRALQIDRGERTREQLLEELSQAGKIDPEEKEVTRQLITHINNWKADVGLFVFGYLIFKICSRIKKLNKKTPAQMEREIWLASFWDCDVNRVLLKK